MMNSKKYIIRTALIFLVIFVNGCYYDTEERLYPKISNPCDDTVVTFSKTVTPILHSCLNCHANSNAAAEGAGIKLENYADVKIYASEGHLMAAIRHEPGHTPMPLGGGKLQDCEINQLQKWIDANTPNN